MYDMFLHLHQWKLLFDNNFRIVVLKSEVTGNSSKFPTFSETNFISLMTKFNSFWKAINLWDKNKNWQVSFQYTLRPYSQFGSYYDKCFFHFLGDIASIQIISIFNKVNKVNLDVSNCGPIRP